MAKLHLNRETLRTLSNSKAAAIAGGYITEGCDPNTHTHVESYQDTCPGFTYDTQVGETTCLTMEVANCIGCP